MLFDSFGHDIRKSSVNSKTFLLPNDGKIDSRPFFSPSAAEQYSCIA
jgi:hypothetical protein